MCSPFGSSPRDREGRSTMSLHRDTRLGRRVNLENAGRRGARDVPADCSSLCQRGLVASSRSHVATACSSRLASRRCAARAWEAVMVFGSVVRAKRRVGAAGDRPERGC